MLSSPPCPVYPLILSFIAILFFGLGACDSPIHSREGQANLASAKVLSNGVRYSFVQKNDQNPKAKIGDRVSFLLEVRNHLDSVLSRQKFKELPLEENFFIGKEYFKEVFLLLHAGDSLSFWINSDSLFNKPGYLKSPKIPPSSDIHYLLKVEEIQSPQDIQKKLEENLKVQREEDENKIERYLGKLSQEDSSFQFIRRDSGLRYSIQKEGKGSSPQVGDTVIVQYESKLLEGETYDRSEGSTEFVLGNALPAGLDEGITLLKSGGKATFLIPSELGFGPKGMGSVVPPNSVLIFEVELIEIK